MNRTHSITAREFAVRVLFPIPDDYPDAEWFDFVQSVAEARSDRSSKVGNHARARFFYAVRNWVVRFERKHIYQWRE